MRYIGKMKLCETDRFTKIVYEKGYIYLFF